MGGNNAVVMDAGDDWGEDRKLELGRNWPIRTWEHRREKKRELRT